jgi:hypothetical protein
LVVVFYFDPGVSFVTSVTNESLDCPFQGPPASRLMIVRAYADNGFGPIQWREVPIVVPPILPGVTVGGVWNDPGSAWGQRNLKFDMHAMKYVVWLEWLGVRISPIYTVYNPYWP